MYGFLNDGEFVQLTVEDQGHVIGFISRYADSSHEGGFLEHFLSRDNSRAIASCLPARS